MTQAIDNIIAARILYLLNTPFEKTDAYKLGIIDKEGEVLKKPSTIDEFESYTYLHRIIFQLKRLLAKLPGGSSKLATLAASYYLVKEEADLNLNDEDMYDLYLSYKNSLSEGQINLFEEVPATNVGNVAGLQTEPIGVKVRKDNMKRRKSFKEFINGITV